MLRNHNYYTSQLCQEQFNFSLQQIQAETAPQSSPPWIQFEFHTAYFIGNVEIYNRRDCCKERLFPFDLLILTEDDSWEKCQNKSFDIGDPEIPSVDTEPIVIHCGDVFGKSIKLTTLRVINICEVKVFGY